MKFYTLYVHIVPNGKLYIGITCRTPNSRWGVNGSGYFSKDRKKQLPFCNAIQKYGWDNIKHIVLLENLSKEIANECEKYLIAKYRTNELEYGYNLTAGGEGISGFHHSGETCNKLKESLTGRSLSELHKKHISDGLKGKPNTWQKNIPLSDEVKRKISNSLKGHEVSESTREKIRVANTGRYVSDETRLKQSINNGMHNPEVVERVKSSLKKSQKERTSKRMATMKERYPNGIKQSEESNKLRSLALKGVPKSEETKQKMRKPKSPETIEKMRKAQKEAWKRRKENIGGSQ